MSGAQVVTNAKTKCGPWVPFQDSERDEATESNHEDHPNAKTKCGQLSPFPNSARFAPDEAEPAEPDHDNDQNANAKCLQLQTQSPAERLAELESRITQRDPISNRRERPVCEHCNRPESDSYEHKMRCRGTWQAEQDRLRDLTPDNWSYRDRIRRLCARCGKIVYARRTNTYRVCWDCFHANQRAAVKRCQQARRVTHDPIPCQQCGESFQPKRTTAKYCSAKCRAASHRARGQEAGR